VVPPPLVGAAAEAGPASVRAKMPIIMATSHARVARAQIPCRVVFFIVIAPFRIVVFIAISPFRVVLRVDCVVSVPCEIPFGKPTDSILPSSPGTIASSLLHT
jgi:hypothetical protein